MSGLNVYRRLLSDDAGFWTIPIRGTLRAGEFVYTQAIQLRNKRYDHAGRVLQAPVPVISVGNITAGGTGKTPLVVEIARRLERTGWNPAVVARGYGAVPGEPSDEELLTRKKCPGVAYVCDADRHRGAHYAARNLGADVVILDDGFQHRRIHRDLDIVLIDATCPFGYGHVLPRGLLREPLSGLRRADVLVVTRCDQVGRAELDRLETQLSPLAPEAPILRAQYRVDGIERLDGRLMGDIHEAARVFAFAAIARPESFAATLRSLDLKIVGSRWWPDHHVYRAGEIHRTLGDPTLAAYDIALTTEKDGVKLQRLAGLDSAGIGVVRVDLEFLDGGGAALEQRIAGALGEGKKASSHA